MSFDISSLVLLSKTSWFPWKKYVALPKIFTETLLYFRGEVMNGGFGLVLDGSEEQGKKAFQMLNWDVSNGVARR